MSAKRALTCAAAVTLSAVCLCMLALPVPKAVGRGENVLCSWRDGTSLVRYETAVRAFVGVDGEKNITLAQGERYGTVQTSEGFRSAHDVLSGSDLLNLRLLDTERLSRFERTALFRLHGNTVYYAGEPFIYNGNTVTASDRSYAARVVLIEGELPEGYLKSSGANALYLAEGAHLCGADLLESAVVAVEAEAPYTVEGGVVYRTEREQTRLVAVASSSGELRLEDYDYADMGALCACSELTALTLPFIGFARTWHGDPSSMRLSYLFQTENGDTMPEKLTSVSVTGGTVFSDAFYGWERLERIDLCGVDAKNISADAFKGLCNLRILHSPRKDVELAGNYKISRAACGCTIFERSEP